MHSDMCGRGCTSVSRDKTPIEMNMQLGEKGYSVYVFDAESFAGFCGMLSQCSVREFESARYIEHVRVELHGSILRELEVFGPLRD